MSSGYWRSLAELEQTPEFQAFVEREFPEAASEFPEGVSRRRWLQMMSASLALGGLAGCHWEREKIAPFVTRPANRIPGVPQKYATSWELDGVARSLVVTSYDGRPIKIEGNPEHPASLGATDVLSQAMILNLYDPDRMVGVVMRSKQGAVASSWDALIEETKGSLEELRAKGGLGLYLLVEPSSSVTQADLKARLEKVFPKATWLEYASIDRQAEIDGAKAAFGKSVRPQYDLTAANVIVSLEADLFQHHPHAVRYSRDFVNRRLPEAGPMSRLYVIEAGYSATGALADHRLPIKSAEIGAVLGLLRANIEARLKSEKFDAAALSKISSLASDKQKEDALKLIDAIASDLVAQQGKGLVVAGPLQPVAVQTQVFALNQLLKNVGSTVKLTEEALADRPASTAAMQQLAKDVQSGNVQALFILGGNPVYDAPADIQFSALLSKIPQTFHLGDYDDETSEQCQWHLPKAHPLEVWGDAVSYDGTLTLAQPLIEPLHGGKSTIELLAWLVGDEHQAGEPLVKRAVGRYLEGNGSGDEAWRKAVHDGFVAKPILAAVEAGEVKTVAADEAAKESGLELIYAIGPTYDGRFANNGWLQELPNTITKLVWDNAAIFGVHKAAELGLKIGDIIRLKVDSRTLELPVFIQPGQAESTVIVALGYGRTAAGVVGGDADQKIKSIGSNASLLRGTNGWTRAVDVGVEKTARSIEMATTQDHHAIDKMGLEGLKVRLGQLVRETTEEEYHKHPDFAKHVVHVPHLESPWKEPEYDGHKWGMSIDLNKCVGCNACVVACQSENNVPIVGKEQVLRGREMHWIRIDRYFRGDLENPEVVTQPVTCHQCENAPCEQVCPVAATVHSHEGLNDMAYNRCIGTRYCANNCPYKVRRFNFFYFNKKYDEANNELARLVLNPEVTVRLRGVMEKCTYCTQRISAVKIVAKNERRPIADGEIVTACQQVCPSGAIEFGDLSDPSSRVSQAHAKARSYQMLAELNTKPRTVYLAKVRNPHPSLVKKSESAGHGGHHAHE